MYRRELKKLHDTKSDQAAGTTHESKWQYFTTTSFVNAVMTPRPTQSKVQATWYDIYGTIWYMIRYNDMIYMVQWCDIYGTMMWYMIWYNDMIYDMVQWYDIWYGTIWYDIYGTIYDIWYGTMIWYMIWYNMIWYMIWYNIWYMIWYNDMIRYGTMIWYMIWYNDIISTFNCNWVDTQCTARAETCRSYHHHSALRPVLAGTRAQSGDLYGSGTLRSRQVLRGSLPLLSPAFRISHFRRQMPPRPQCERS
jgi:hypothetical protein